MNEIKSVDASVRASNVWFHIWSIKRRSQTTLTYAVRRTYIEFLHSFYLSATSHRSRGLHWTRKKAKRNCACIQNVVVIQIWPSESLNRRSAHAIANDTRIQFTVHSNGYLFDQMELCRLIACFSLSSSFSINDQQTKRKIKESAMHAKCCNFDEF